MNDHKPSYANTARNSDNEEEVVQGYIKRVTYRNEQNGFCVFKLDSPKERGEIAVVGNSLKTSVGAHVVVKGKFINHPKFGRQLSATLITESPPTSPAGLKKYLSGGFIKGIGKKTAEKIVDALGDGLIDTIFNEPEKVAAIPGVGEHKAKLLVQAFLEQKEVDQIIQFLVGHNISPGLAQKIYNHFGGDTLSLITENPYRLAHEIHGIGFKTADEIAFALGVKPDSPERVKAGLFFCLKAASDDGHCLLTKSELFKRTLLLLQLAQTDCADLFEGALETLILEGLLVREHEDIYLKYLFEAENFVANFIAARSQSETMKPGDEDQINKCIKKAELKLGIELSEQQKEAVRVAGQHKFMIITGGPGVGKTTVIRALANFFRLSGKTLCLTAPTGRAAQRMSQVCDYPAQTIHRLLKFDPGKRSFHHGPNNPLPEDAIIVDEASMIDVFLAKNLFSAIRAKTTVILVGDKDQLPSIGPGRLFAELVSIPELKTISLTTLFRRSEDSIINEIANAINQGVMPTIPVPDGATKSNAYFILKPKIEEAAQTVVHLVKNQLQTHFNFKPDDITVLSPSNRGDLGIENLNSLLQEELNPPDATKAEISLKDVTFRKGDRISQRVNNYNLHFDGVFNGDIGKIEEIDPREKVAEIELWDGRLIKYQRRDLDQISHAYAITVHRSQGSEIPCVVLALHESHFTLLERQLIYTAVTRAKELLIIVGSKRALAMAVRRMNAKQRETRLAERILAQLDC